MYGLPGDDRGDCVVGPGRPAAPNQAASTREARPGWSASSLTGCTGPCLFPQHDYFFANESADILTIMGTALDRVGVAWRLNRPNSISVARRDAVALMDQHVGPKR
jgi:hypothetical protein